MPPGSHAANRPARLSIAPDLRALREATEGLGRASDEQAVCDAALAALSRLLGLTFGAAVVWGPEGRASATTGFSPGAALAVESWLRTDAASRPAVVDLASPDAPEAAREAGLVCIAPVVVGAARRGALSVGRERPQGVCDEEIAVLTAVAARAGQALERLERARAVRAERDLHTEGPMVVFAWRASPGWPVEYVSPNAERVLGHAAADFLSGAVPFASIIHPEDQARVAAGLAEASARGDAWVLTRYRVVRPDGGAVAVADTTHLVRDAAGRVTGRHAYLVAEAPRPACGATAAAPGESQAARRVAGCAAAEFNAVLSAIARSAALAAERLPPATPGRAAVEQILRAVDESSAIARGLLAYAGRQAVVPRVLDLRAVVERADGVLRATLPPGVVLGVDLPADLWPVRADAALVERALAELVSNAREAMPEGGSITISACNTAVTAPGEVAPGDYAVLCVRDSGAGIEPGVRPRLFEPFFSTKPAGPGRGLGLAAVEGMARQWGGAVGVESEPGRGAAFSLYLPRHAEPVQEPLARSAQTVLLVEDQDLVRRLMAAMLRDHGYAVLEATSGPGALELAERYADPIHLLITDAAMPEMSGLETAQRLRRLLPGLRALVVSGLAEDAAVRREAEQGSVTFLAKPFAPGDLVRAAQAALRSPPPVEAEEE